MKKFIIILLMIVVAISAKAIEKDTISISQTQITKIVTDTGVSSNGKQYTKYYAIVNGELVSISKSVVEKINLCKKYGAKCAIAGVRNKKTKSLTRIILNLHEKE